MLPVTHVTLLFSHIEKIEKDIKKIFSFFIFLCENVIFLGNRVTKSAKPYFMRVSGLFRMGNIWVTMGNMGNIEGRIDEKAGNKIHRRAGKST